MYKAWFSRPVTVSVGIAGEVHHIMNAEQAVDLLTKAWRGEGSAMHRSALRACRQAISGGISADLACTAFLEAAREARILVE